MIHKDTATKTQKQWLKEGRLIKPDAVGERLYTNGYHQYMAVYYTIEETYEGEPEVIRSLREPELAKKREYSIKRRKYLQAVKFKKESLQKTHLEAVVPCNNPSGIVVFDVETTGLNPYEEEILQFAACDGDGNTLLETYVRPYIKEEWSNAQKINGISPAMVENAPYMHEIIPVLKGIFDSAKLLVTYNGIFDERFLEEYGIDLRAVPEYDAMTAFAPIYGEWDEYHCDYRWQKLSTCAAYYNYFFLAHDAMEDVKATLLCYKCMANKENT